MTFLIGITALALVVAVVVGAYRLGYQDGYVMSHQVVECREEEEDELPDNVVPIRTLRTGRRRE